MKQSVQEFLILSFYNLFLSVFLLLFSPFFLKKVWKRKGFDTPLLEKFGILKKEKSFGKENPIYIRSVSIGETKIAQKIISQWSKRNSSLQFILSVTTMTAYKLVKKTPNPSITLVYSPFDLPLFVRKHLNFFSPQAIILIESDIWLNFISESHSREIPISIVDFRLSPASEKRFIRWRKILSLWIKKINIIFLKESSQSIIFERMEIEDACFLALGSVKYDLEEKVPSKNSYNLSTLFKERKTLFLISTHPKEESWILSSIPRKSNFFYIIAPRHVERAKSLEKELCSLGFKVLRFSQLNSTKLTNPDILLIDVMGEVSSLFPYAKVAIMGKSFLHSGGQNPIEPLSFGIPVIFGPHMENFGDLAKELIKTHSALSVSSKEELSKVITSLFSGKINSTNLIQNAQKTLNFHRGSTERIISSLETSSLS